jgi:hypothetical protein
MSTRTKTHASTLREGLKHGTERWSTKIGKKAKAAAAEEKRQLKTHMEAFEEEQAARIKKYLEARAAGKKPKMPDLVNVKVPNSALGGGRRRTRRRKTRSTRRR